MTEKMGKKPQELRENFKGEVHLHYSTGAFQKFGLAPYFIAFYGHFKVGKKFKKICNTINKQKSIHIFPIIALSALLNT
jgi:hypothetical protein